MFSLKTGQEARALIAARREPPDHLPILIVGIRDYVRIKEGGLAAGAGRHLAKPGPMGAVHRKASRLLAAAGCWVAEPIEAQALARAGAAGELEGDGRP